MSKTMKIMLFTVLLMAVLLFVPTFCSAANLEVNDGATLRSQIAAAGNDDVVVLTDDVTITGPITVTGKNITVDGQGKYSIIGDWTSTSGNQTMITALTGTTVTLKDISLENGPKYGVQAYNGGEIVLDNVSIKEFNYGAVLVNGGTVTVKKLHLGLNGNKDTNYNGIEIDCANGVTGVPTLVMDGTLTAEQSENVIYLATNSSLSTYKVENGVNAVNKVAVAGNKVVLTDKDGNVAYMSNEPKSGVTGSDDMQDEKVILSVHADGKTINTLVNKDTVLKYEDVSAMISVKEGYVLEGLYQDEQYTSVVDFTKAITANTDIFAKIEKEVVVPPTDVETDVEDNKNEEEKDETPKTGVSTYVGVATILAVTSLGAILVLKKKN